MELISKNQKITFFVIPFFLYLMVHFLDSFKNDILTQVLILTILFSFPHFIATYFIFYKKFINTKILNLVGYVFPVIFLLLSSVILYFDFKFILVVAIYLTLGWLYWHFATQAFGVLAWTSSNLNSDTKKLIKVALIMVSLQGLVHSLNGQGNISVFKYYLDKIHFTQNYILATDIITWSFFILSVGVFIFDSFFKNKTNYVLGFFVIVSFSLWFVLARFNPWMYVLIPVLHGLQFIPFGHFAIKKLSTINILLFAGLFIFLGYLLFQKSIIWLAPVVNAETIALILIFLNLHHFIVDSFLWKKQYAHYPVSSHS